MRKAIYLLVFIHKPSQTFKSPQSKEVVKPECGNYFNLYPLWNTRMSYYYWHFCREKLNFVESSRNGEGPHFSVAIQAWVSGCLPILPMLGGVTPSIRAAAA